MEKQERGVVVAGSAPGWTRVQVTSKPWIHLPFSTSEQELLIVLPSSERVPLLPG